eukprot:GGOE01019430.1.p1 GENE.GGOE01019430.1~~GGOE01019430.1.p1  ORF type:complete len:289 (-),score=67.57 GGOE01019430.1:296-1162(-)
MPEAKGPAPADVPHERKRDKLKHTFQKLFRFGSEESLKGSTSAKSLEKDKPKATETANKAATEETSEHDEDCRRQAAETEQESAKLARLEGDGLQGGVVGQPLHFIVVHPKEFRANYHFNVTGPKAPDIQKKIMKDGNISIDVTFSEKGAYKLHVNLGTHSCPISGSPFKLMVHQDEVAMSKFQAEAAGQQEDSRPQLVAEEDVTSHPPPADNEDNVVQPATLVENPAKEAKNAHETLTIVSHGQAVPDEVTVKAPLLQATLPALPVDVQQSAAPTASSFEPTVVAPR